MSEIELGSIEVPILRRPLRPRPLLGSSALGSVSADQPSVSPVRERTRTVTESTLKAQVSRGVRDKVLDALSDGRYHSAHELENLFELKPGDWVVAIRELIEYSYAFTRRSNSLLVRRRSLSERPQDLADLLALIDARTPEDINLTSSAAAPAPSFAPRSKMTKATDAEESEEDGPFEGEHNAVVIDDGDRVVLSSDESSGFVVSGKQLVTSTQAILAKKRSGKTYLAMVMAEQFLKLKLPFVAVDPTGVWCGLRTMADGTPSSYDVLTLGGPRGHWPLSAGLGSKVADLVVDVWPRSVILDLSAMVPEEQHEFVYYLCARIFFINKKPVHFFFDEADEFAPQVSDANYKFQRRCLSAIDRLVRRGGVKGLGGTLITQRPAVISKNVLSQVSRVIVLNMVAPHDIEAVEEWMKGVVSKTQDRIACLSALPSLGPGEAFAVTNGAGAVPLVKFKTRVKETFDSSKTPTMDAVDLPAPEVSNPPIDVIERAGVLLGLSGVDTKKVESADERFDEE